MLLNRQTLWSTPESIVFLKRTIDLQVQSLGTPTSGGYVTIGIGDEGSSI